MLAPRIWRKIIKQLHIRLISEDLFLFKKLILLNQSANQISKLQLIVKIWTTIYNFVRPDYSPLIQTSPRQWAISTLILSDLDVTYPSLHYHPLWRSFPPNSLQFSPHYSHYIILFLLLTTSPPPYHQIIANQSATADSSSYWATRSLVRLLAASSFPECFVAIIIVLFS